MRAGGALIVAVLLAGCGGTPRPAAPRAPKPLVYVWRNFEETGIPEEMTVYTDGAVAYRNLLHTQRSLKVVKAHLRPSQLSTLRGLLARIDLRRADASGVKPRRSGYRYIIRSRGRVGTAADGHLQGPIRPLVVHLRAEMDRLQQASL
jgi:hypothetical protein